MTIPDDSPVAETGKMAEDEQNQAEELPAPVGWRKIKLSMKKKNTPRKSEIVFISPTGEEIKTRKQLDHYLRKHPGGLSYSEFDWGASGDAPRRSSRLSDKKKAMESAESEPSMKRPKLSSSKLEKMKDDNEEDTVMQESEKVSDEAVAGMLDEESKVHHVQAEVSVDAKDGDINSVITDKQAGEDVVIHVVDTGDGNIQVEEKKELPTEISSGENGDGNEVTEVCEENVGTEGCFEFQETGDKMIAEEKNIAAQTDIGKPSEMDVAHEKDGIEGSDVFTEVENISNTEFHGSVTGEKNEEIAKFGQEDEMEAGRRQDQIENIADIAEEYTAMKSSMEPESVHVGKKPEEAILDWDESHDNVYDMKAMEDQDANAKFATKPENIVEEHFDRIKDTAEQENSDNKFDTSYAEQAVIPDENQLEAFKIEEKQEMVPELEERVRDPMHEARRVPEENRDHNEAKDTSVSSQMHSSISCEEGKHQLEASPVSC